MRNFTQVPKLGRFQLYWNVTTVSYKLQNNGSEFLFKCYLQKSCSVEILYYAFFFQCFFFNLAHRIILLVLELHDATKGIHFCPLFTQKLGIWLPTAASWRASCPCSILGGTPKKFCHPYSPAYLGGGVREFYIYSRIVLAFWDGFKYQSLLLKLHISLGSPAP